ncbi:MAG: hypothetical protein D3923_08105 [Candidatus Electrothrix sp. AR3]|nr:hypothetical protein [Candidatus Electrothrix sp. AR3]
MSVCLGNKIDPALLGFDFDGVIANTAESFLRLACADYGLCDARSEDITNFEVEECLGLKREEADAVFTKILQDSLGTGLQPMPGAVEVLTELTEQAMVTVITARPLAAPVLDWFVAFLPQATLASIRLVAMGAHDGKADYILKQGLRYFVDDRAATCVQLHDAGIQPFVFRQPWNQACQQFPLIHSWQDIRALCL